MAEVRAGEDAILSKVGAHATNVTIGKDIRINMPDGEPLDMRMVRVEVRLNALERSQSSISWSLLVMAVSLVLQMVWTIQTQDASLRDISDKIGDTNRHIVRLETLWSAGERFRSTTPEP